MRALPVICPFAAAGSRVQRWPRDTGLRLFGQEDSEFLRQPTGMFEVSRDPQLGKQGSGFREVAHGGIAVLPGMRQGGELQMRAPQLEPRPYGGEDLTGSLEVLPRFAQQPLGGGNSSRN